MNLIGVLNFIVLFLFLVRLFLVKVLKFDKLDLDLFFDIIGVEVIVFLVLNVFFREVTRFCFLIRIEILDNFFKLVRFNSDFFFLFNILLVFFCNKSELSWELWIFNIFRLELWLILNVLLVWVGGWRFLGFFFGFWVELVGCGGEVLFFILKVKLRKWRWLEDKYFLIFLFIEFFLLFCVIDFIFVVWGIWILFKL